MESRGRSSRARSMRGAVPVKSVHELLPCTHGHGPDIGPEECPEEAGPEECPEEAVPVKSVVQTISLLCGE